MNFLVTEWSTKRYGHYLHGNVFLVYCEDKCFSIKANNIICAKKWMNSSAFKEETGGGILLHAVHNARN
jgi:hypothetical protein